MEPIDQSPTQPGEVEVLKEKLLLLLQWLLREMRELKYAVSNISLYATYTLQTNTLTQWSCDC
jgi:hypothetical protein